MTSDPDDSPQERKRLDPVQIAAGALAAVTAAAIGSRLGVNGTVIGAAVGSVVGSVGSASYAQFLGRTAHRVRAVASAPGRERRTGATDRTVVMRPEGSLAGAEDPTGQQPLWDTGPQGDPPAELVADTRESPAVDTAPRRTWRAAILAAVATFVVALVALTAFELLSGRPVSTITGGTSGGGTTLSDLFDPPDATPTPTGSPTPTTSTAPEPSSPSPTESTSAPSASPSTIPTETSTSLPSTSLP